MVKWIALGKQKYRALGSGQFYHITFTYFYLCFLLFLAPVGGSNPTVPYFQHTPQPLLNQNLKFENTSENE